MLKQTFSEFLNESKKDYYITVSVRDAKDAQEIISDILRKSAYTQDGSNSYIIEDEEYAFAVLESFNNNDIEIESTNINDLM